LPKALDIPRPDDWHLHLRDGAMLAAVLPQTARHFARALVMPNLVPPVVTAADAAAYRRRILDALPADARFEPLMTLYLTEASDPADVERAFRERIALAVKLYPAGATTNSQSGVRDIEAAMPVLERMAKIGMPLCVHGETTDPAVDIFDRERVFLERTLEPLRRRLPELRIVLEHVTTQDGIRYVQEARTNLAATLTVHHLIINRNAILAGGIRPHYYCLPVAKRESHRLALRRAAVSGDRRFFLGTDSAPHADRLKEHACGCAGCFTAPVALACLAQVFEEEGALPHLAGFVSLHGADWYGVPHSRERIRLTRVDGAIDLPRKIAVGEETVTLFDPMFPIHWQAEDA
jgi:dihydroorotase